ncbi:hypothetical protein L6164_012518 [Bauhinia variegata]|uniref:Uncharacterized protein n=1 Tax=Bauhinia variegata TaxID=167791 RepID=A0ACB9PA78_BAUVA|nr:hypothetical protein L6164_012518 [Bauhinia variegata]
MNKGTSDPGSSSSSVVHAVRPERDLAANWEVDLAKELENYLLKICSGTITGEDEARIQVNFSEAALLIQNSVQVYSRKVEYLYTLVLRTIEFLSQTRLQDHLDDTSVQPEESGSRTAAGEENDQFWDLDDIPVEENNSLDSKTEKEVNLNHFVKAPSNLVVLEGDCLDATGDGGELESYLLYTTYMYKDFMLLDKSDAVAVDEFLKGNQADTGHNGACRETPTRKSFLSPTTRSGGTANKSSAGKNRRANSNHSPQINCEFDANNAQPSSPASAGFGKGNFGFDMGYGSDASGDLNNSDDDDPWKPLNPHEPGNLKVKPFRKVKAVRRNGIISTPQVSMTTLFPPAKYHGPVSPELMEAWKMQHEHPQSPPFYEKMRQYITNHGNKAGGTFPTPGDYNNDNGYDNGNPDFDAPGHDFTDEDVPAWGENHDRDDAHFEADEDVGHEFPSSQQSLEDLCRSHMDALLARIAETERQTEIATRVSKWKQGIEQNLEEQESLPPFDIHDYGERILDKLSLEASNSDVLSFTDVIKGKEKYDVARSFSALLQLVNNGDVDLERSGVQGESVCYTAENPFRVKLLNHGKKQKGMQLRISKNRVKTPMRKASTRERSPATIKSSRKHEPTTLSPQANRRPSRTVGELGAVRCTPEGKRRRRSSRIAAPVNSPSVG